MAAKLSNFDPPDWTFGDWMDWEVPGTSNSQHDMFWKLCAFECDGESEVPGRMAWVVRAWTHFLSTLWCWHTPYTKATALQECDALCSTGFAMSPWNASLQGTNVLLVVSTPTYFLHKNHHPKSDGKQTRNKKNIKPPNIQPTLITIPTNSGTFGLFKSQLPRVGHGSATARGVAPAPIAGSPKGPVPGRKNICGKSSTTNLPFGDDTYHPFISIYSDSGDDWLLACYMYKKWLVLLPIGPSYGYDLPIPGWATLS